VNAFYEENRKLMFMFVDKNVDFNDSEQLFS